MADKTLTIIEATRRRLPAAARHKKLVRDLQDGEVFSLDAGATWHVCAVPLFGSVAVHLDHRHNDDAPTRRIDALQDAEVIVTAPAPNLPAVRPVCPTDPTHGHMSYRRPHTYEQRLVGVTYGCGQCQASVTDPSLEFIEWIESEGWHAYANQLRKAREAW